MNRKGISVISLVIMIVVIVLITSITIFNGMNMVEHAHLKTANDRLMTIAVAIVAHEKELGYGDNVYSTTDTTVEEIDRYIEITSGDYEIMGLENYKDTSNYPPTYIYKQKSDASKQVTYKLRTPVTVKKGGIYNEEDFVSYEYVYYDAPVDENYKVEFDTIKGVNRPMLTKDMKPVKTYFDKGNSLKTTLVEDIYTDEWYDYSTDSTIWANAMMNNSRLYVWIPRFAYKIQNLYLTTDFNNVPASAIDIIFLRGTTDYMPNDEVIPNGYQVHPAFKYKVGGKEVNIPGFWVAKNNIDNLVDVLYRESEGSSVDSAFDKAQFSNLHPNADASNIVSRLMKNTEWSAIAYLSHHTVGRCVDGMSLNTENATNSSGVFELDVPCFVAGGLSSKISSALSNDSESFDRYSYTDPENTVLTYDSYEDEGKKYGDAMLGTSSNNSEESAWFGGKSVKPTSFEPYILRGIDDNLFAYKATSRTPEHGAGCRNVLIISSK